MAVFDPDLQPSSDRGHLLTEQSNQRSSRLDQLDTLALVELFADEDRRPQEAVAAVAPALAQAVDAVAERLRAGGRLFYLGAGTSGRLGVLDAAECPPTFCSDPQQVQGVLAGGTAALLRSSEGLEDIEAAGRADLEERGFCAKDCLVGIAAGGTTPYAVDWRSRQISAPSPSPWPAFRRSKPLCPATLTSASSQALSC
jgi:N-acetylmuramic acid 6-phosphate etherase